MDAPDLTRGGITQNEDGADDIGELDSVAVFPTTQPLDAISTHPPAGKTLTPERARALTDAIRCDMSAVWAQLLRAFEGNAHGALGYTSWSDYCSTEFGIERSRSYRMLNAARVVEVLGAEAQSPMGDSTDIPERVARELTPLLDDPETLVAALEEAKAEASMSADGTPKVTAARVREKVQAKVETKPAAPKPNMRHLADRPIESGARISPALDVPSPQPAKEPPKVAPPTVLGTVQEVVTALGAGDMKAVRNASAAALRVLARRRMGTSPEALAKALEALLRAIAGAAQ